MVKEKMVKDLKLDLATHHLFLYLCLLLKVMVRMVKANHYYYLKESATHHLCLYLCLLLKVMVR